MTFSQPALEEESAETRAQWNNLLLKLIHIYKRLFRIYQKGHFQLAFENFLNRMKSQ